MSKRAKIILGIATIWPILYGIIFFIFIFFILFLSNQQQPNKPPTGFFVILPLHFLTMLDIFVLLVIYITNLFKNERVENHKKVLWAVVLFMGNMIAMPIYWYLYIWKDSSKDTTNIEPQNSINPPIIARSEKDPFLS